MPASEGLKRTREREHPMYACMHAIVQQDLLQKLAPHRKEDEVG